MVHVFLSCDLRTPLRPTVRYHVTLESAPGSTPIVVDVDELPGGAWDVRVEGRSVPVDVAIVGDQLSVRVDGRVVDLTTFGSLPDLWIAASGQRADVRVESDRQRAAHAGPKEASEPIEKVVLSPMPGRVVKVFVQKGDVVEAGQPLVVMEAMKMENEIRAKTAGTVTEVHVATGAAVEGNARLVTLA
jgi:biotin carboxyl carrier protein